MRHPATVVVRVEALGRDGQVEGSAALLARLEPERVRSAAAEAIAPGTPP